MLKSYFSASVAAIALLTAVPAFADQPGNAGQGQGGCGVGQTTNGCGVETAAGPSVVNTNTISNNQNQAQHQLQAQEQHQFSASVAAASAGATSSASQSQTLSGSGNSDVRVNPTQTTSVDGNNADQKTDVRVEGDHTVYEDAKNRVNTAYAAPVTIGGGVCAYTPATGGLTTFSFSVSGSGAKIDPGCERRANADVLARLGYAREAAALLLQDKNVAKAFESVRNAEK